MQTLYAKYGGHGTVSKVVNQFYFQLLSSETLSKFFTEIDMEPLIEHQIEFVSTALGKKSKYTGQNMIQAHQSLNIQNAEYEDVSEIFLQTLENNGFEMEDLITVKGILDSLKCQIVRS